MSAYTILLSVPPSAFLSVNSQPNSSHQLQSCSPLILSPLLWGGSETCLLCIQTGSSWPLPAWALQQDASAADSNLAPNARIWFVTREFYLLRAADSQAQGSPCNMGLTFARDWAMLFARGDIATYSVSSLETLLCSAFVGLYKATPFSSKISYLSEVCSSSLSALWLGQPCQLHFPSKATIPLSSSPFMSNMRSLLKIL